MPSARSDADHESAPPLGALHVANFRIFIAGQSVILIGSWVQTVAEALLVLSLTDSGWELGLVTAARYLPILLLTPYAGLIVDRSYKRLLLLATSATLAALSVIAGLLVLSDTVTLTWVTVLALAFGCVSAVDNPARQAFIPELVDVDVVRSAIAVNSTCVNVGRALGPLAAALLIATVGIGWCFLVNAVSFVAVLCSLVALTTRALSPSRRVTRAPRQLLDGFAYARSAPRIMAPIVMMALIGTFAYELEVSLPLFAKNVLGDADSYPWLTGAFGIGSVAGGIYCIYRRAFDRRILIASSALALALGGTALCPSILFAVPLLLIAGFAGIVFVVTGNSTVQLLSPPEKRGRIVALWSTAFLGSTPIGAPIVGALGTIDPRLALGAGGVACALAALVGWSILRRDTTTPRVD